MTRRRTFSRRAASSAPTLPASPHRAARGFVRAVVFKSPRAASATWWRWQDDLLNLLLGALRTATAEIARWGRP